MFVVGCHFSGCCTACLRLTTFPGNRWFIFILAQMRSDSDMFCPDFPEESTSLEFYRWNTKLWFEWAKLPWDRIWINPSTMCINSTGDTVGYKGEISEFQSSALTTAIVIDVHCGKSWQELDPNRRLDFLLMKMTARRVWKRRKGNHRLVFNCSASLLFKVFGSLINHNMCRHIISNRCSQRISLKRNHLYQDQLTWNTSQTMIYI